ncbi:hypothetical protein [Maritalea sp.]|uniref:hypothetical protein n=1 Tax=Maritalea sp. TaxID=2003361 RepID=UPI003EF93CF7
MSSISSVSAAPQEYSRPDPVRSQQTEAVRNRDKVEDVQASKKQDVDLQTDQRQEVKTPERDGTGWVVDKEA